MDKLLDFTGRVALVTGGSRGLGRQMALALAERGANVVVTSRKAEACAEVAAEIEAMGRQAMAYGCHVGHWDEIDGLVEAAYSRFGRIDVLINNAGITKDNILMRMKEDEWQQVIDTNLNNIKTQLKKLEEMNDKIGTNEDSSKFRVNIETELKKAG